VRRADNLHVSIVLKCGSLTFLEPSGPIRACNGIALPFYYWKSTGLESESSNTAMAVTAADNDLIKFGESSKNNNFVVVVMKIVMK